MGTMSYYFDVHGETIWNPSLRVGKLYLGIAECVAVLVGSERPVSK